MRGALWEPLRLDLILQFVLGGHNLVRGFLTILYLCHVMPCYAMLCHVYFLSPGRRAFTVMQPLSGLLYAAFVRLTFCLHVRAARYAKRASLLMGL